MKGERYVVTCLIFSSVLYSVLTCKSSLQRKNEYTGTVTVCCTTNCTPGFYVEKCTVNGTADRCVQCPEGTYLDDYTTSVLPTHCIPYGCPPGAIPVENFSKSGCHKKCQCDVSLEYVGTDPCNCQKSSVTCPRGLQLTIHNACNAITKQSLILSSLITPSGLTDGITTKVVGPEISTVTETVTTPANRSDPGIITPTGDGGSVLGAVLGGAGVVVVVALVVALVFIIRRFRQETSQQENQIEVDTLDHPRIRTGDHSGEVNSNGSYRPCNGGPEIRNKMGIGETTQNGDIHVLIPLLVDTQPQETSNITLYTKKTDQKKVVTGCEHHTVEDEETVDPPLVTPSVQISSNTEAEPWGSTIGLLSASTLNPESIQRGNDYPDSIKLEDAPPLIPDSIR